MLLESGADSLATNHKGRTPVDWAAGSGQMESLRLLVDQFAKDGKTNVKEEHARSVKSHRSGHTTPTGTARGHHDDRGTRWVTHTRVDGYMCLPRARPLFPQRRLFLSRNREHSIVIVALATRPAPFSGIEYRAGGRVFTRPAGSPHPWGATS